MSDRPAANGLLRTVLLILIVMFILGSLPMWGWSSGWGYYPAGGGGLILVVLLVLLITGNF